MSLESANDEQEDEGPVYEQRGHHIQQLCRRQGKNKHKQPNKAPKWIVGWD